MDIRARLPAFAEVFAFALIFAAFVTIQILVGGTRMVFSLPSYIAIGAAGLLLLFAVRQPKPAPCRACLIVTGLAFAYLIGRALLSPMPYIARSDLYSAAAGFAVYLAVALILTTNTARMFFLLGLLLLGLGDVFIGAIQFRDANNFMPISWLQRYDYGARASGFYVCPNHLAGFFEVVGIFGVSIACWSRWPVWAKLLLGYVVACCYVGLILTGSRGGYLSTGTSFGVFAALSLFVLRRSTQQLFWRVTLLSVAVVILLSGAAVFGVAKSNFLSYRAQKVTDTSNIRRDLWDAALEEWKVAPVFGTGSATYLYYGRFFRKPEMQLDPVYVHNDYLQLLAEYGLLGATAVGGVLFVHVRRGVRSYSRLGAKRVAVSERLFSNGLALNIGALASLAAIAVHSALDFNLHIPANALLMAFVFAILANDGVVRDRGASVVATGDVLWRVGLAALSAVLVVQGMRLLPGEYYAERARAGVRDNRPAVALAEAARALRYDPRNPDVYLHIGDARTALAENIGEANAAESFYNGAIVAFQRARELAPQEVTYALALASTLDAVGRFPEAEWIYYEAMQLDPKSKSLRKYYAGHLADWQKSDNQENPAADTRVDDKNG